MRVEKERELEDSGAEEGSSSLYSKMFADRGPEKRKIKFRPIAEQVVDDGEGEDSDYKYISDTDNNETDDTIVSDKEPENTENMKEIPIPDSNENIENTEGRQEFNENNEEVTTEFLKKWKVEDPGVCCICLENSTTEENMLVYCDGDECEVVCHQECYGIIHLPASDEPWYCDRCLAIPSETIICALCPKRHGAFRRIKDGDSAGIWVHVVCALWMPGMWIGKTAEMSEITIENIDQKNWNRPCCVCTGDATNEGATVHCDAGECKNWLHVTCAQSLNLLECVEDDQDISDPYFVYCPSHGSHGPARLNEWEKWCRRKDRFFENIREVESKARTERVKKDSDMGASLREIFEDSYAEYHKRREEKIANQRRKIAQINSSIQGLIEQSEKAESNVIDFNNKIEIASQENAALESYLLRAQKALMLLSQSITNVDALQLSDTEDTGSNRPKVEAYLGVLESTNEIQWTQEAKENAQNIVIDQLDTSSVQNLGIKNVQKIMAQMAKEQKSRRGKRGKKRKVSVPEASSRGVKRSRKTEEPSPKAPKKTSTSTSSTTSRKTRGRRPKNGGSSKEPNDLNQDVISDGGILKEGSMSNEEKDKEKEGDGDLLNDGDIINNDILNDGDVEEDKAEEFNNVLPNDISHTPVDVNDISLNSNDVSPTPNDANGVSFNASDANDVSSTPDDSNDASPYSDDISFNANDVSPFPNDANGVSFNVSSIPHNTNGVSFNTNDALTNGSSNYSPPSTILGVLNISTLLNPIESTPPSRNSPDKEVSTSIDIPIFQNNYIDSAISNHLNIYPNEIEVIEIVDDNNRINRFERNDVIEIIDEPEIIEINSTNENGPSDFNASMSVDNSTTVTLSTAAINNSISSYTAALNRNDGYESSPSQSTATAFAHYTSHITPAATGPLFTATPTAAGFFTTTPVNPDLLPEHKRKRKPVEIEPIVESINDRNKKFVKRKSKKSSSTQFGQIRKIVIPPQLRPRVPQPVCRVCNQIEPPPHDQPSATYIYPAKARESMLLKGRDKVHRMVRCNYCSKWYHLACMNPPRKTMPTGGYIWRCEECDNVDLDNTQSGNNGNNHQSEPPEASSSTSSNHPSSDNVQSGSTTTKKWRLRSSTKRT
ncbi:hypothetical protein Glove_416g2 [Diversispora epigaea]|uniref:PHD-type domain-containing protein n=1 Tax=Diversispora epigaea TaxID=1348612 RepID=A0A397H0X0_9GLOM|nr:hypothetical protein Glove_416g2 [Diversispora epigaea]